MKTILLATDFSPAALNAARYAADMAVSIHADLHLLHVYQMPVLFLEVPLAVTTEEMKEDAEKELLKIKKALVLKTAGKITVETEVRMGVFFQQLKMVCERIVPYTVVMGSQGSTAAERLLLGGHTVYAMKHLAWPLMTVPPGVVFSPVKKIGLACDFDKVVDEINVDEIKTLVHDFAAELHIINTGKPDRFDPEIVFESGVLERKLLPVKPNYHFISNPDTDEGIIDFVDQNNIDMLVVLPKRHSLLDKLVHSSHTRKLVMHSHVPVMAIHQ